jgi:emp24/gp25L/p24 family/GOLD
MISSGRPRCQDWDAIAKKENLNAMATELRKLEDTVREIHRMMMHLRQREEEMRDLNGNTTHSSPPPPQEKADQPSHHRRFPHMSRAWRAMTRTESLCGLECPGVKCSWKRCSFL